MFYLIFTPHAWHPLNDAKPNYASTPSVEYNILAFNDLHIANVFAESFAHIVAGKLPEGSVTMFDQNNDVGPFWMVMSSIGGSFGSFSIADELTANVVDFQLKPPNTPEVVTKTFELMIPHAI